MRQILLSAIVLTCTALNTWCAEASKAESDKNKAITIYFSCTGTTEGIAYKVHNAAGGDILRIEPMITYTAADLDYTTDCRANREQNDPSSRPTIKTSLPDMIDYSVVFLGYPIWWGKAPKIIYTLLESEDFSHKIIIPFCTSGSSGIAGSEPELHGLVNGATWIAGSRFASNASQSVVTEWVNSVMPSINNKMESYRMNIKVKGSTLTATMAINEATKELKELLENGSIAVNLQEYGGFERVGSLPQSLTTHDEYMTAVAGDIVLYISNQIVFMLGNNSWSYTRLGHIDADRTTLESFFGSGNVTAMLSLSDDSGITSLPSDTSEAAEYYDVQGRKIMGRQHGIMIERRGNNHSKLYKR